MTVSNSFPLSFGQLAAWAASQGPWNKFLNFTDVWPIPEGTSRASVETALNTLTERHETLRTNYVDGGLEHGPRQVILGPPRIEVAVLEVDNDAWARDEMLASAPKSVSGFFDCGFSITEGLNWKSAIVEVSGQPRYLCFVCHHIVADMSGVVRLGDELLAILDGTDVDGQAKARIQPRELAEIERSGEPGRGKSTMGYWSDLLSALPGTASLMVEKLAIEDRDQVIGRSSLRTSLELRRLNQLASGYGVPLSALSLCLMLVGIWRSLSEEVQAIPVGVVCWNRFTPQLQSLVGTVSIGVPILVDVTAVAGLDELARLTHRATIRAYRHASVDCTEIARKKEAMEAARGLQLDIPFGFAAQLDRRVHRPRGGQQAPRKADEFVRLPPIGLPREQGRTLPTLHLNIRADSCLNIWVNADSTYGHMADNVLRTVREGLAVLLAAKAPGISVRDLCDLTISSGSSSPSGNRD